MSTVNAHLSALHGSYLFSEIGRRVAAFSQEKPDEKLLKLGIGDVTRPIAPAVVDALRCACDEMGRAETFRGYAPAQGYGFLIEAILRTEYEPMGVTLSPDEIFVSDGAKSDTGNFQELISTDAVVAVCDPVYPVYMDSNRMAGREVVNLPCRAETGFVPDLPPKPVSAVYLCNPNNPTGVALNRETLREWVRYARENGVLLLYDAAYRAYVTADDVPRSIFEIDGAKEVAVEFCSLSKSAGFTGLRCAWTVVPDENRWDMNRLWARRVATKFNGVAYPIQRAAEAALLPGGRAQSDENVRYYLENAKIIRDALLRAGLTVYGGSDAPYVWVRCPDGLSGWDWFDRLLTRDRIVCTPGEGFGECGAGYVRFSSFAARGDCLAMAQRMTGGSGWIM